MSVPYEAYVFDIVLFLLRQNPPHSMKIFSCGYLDTQSAYDQTVLPKRFSQMLFTLSLLMFLAFGSGITPSA